MQILGRIYIFMKDVYPREIQDKEYWKIGCENCIWKYILENIIEIH